MRRAKKRVLLLDSAQMVLSEKTLRMEDDIDSALINSW
jgi:hypothetical protein